MIAKINENDQKLNRAKLIVKEKVKNYLFYEMY